MHGNMGQITKKHGFHAMPHVQALLVLSPTQTLWLGTALSGMCPFMKNPSQRDIALSKEQLAREQPTSSPQGTHLCVIHSY